MKTKVCVIGSGAGAGPIISELAKAGHEVVVLEKGPWIKTSQYTKDEMVATRRSVYTPRLKDECHDFVFYRDGEVSKEKNGYKSGKDFWNGNVVGGSSNFMSGYFHRMKPKDFNLLSTYGPIDNANVVDWPIGYDDLEQYYTKVESEIGVSGKVVDHKHHEPRSTDDFPFPPLGENKIAGMIDTAADKLGYTVVPVARGILSRKSKERSACFYSGYCGSYGCESDAKGSSRAALLEDAAKLENCTIIPNAKVFRLEASKKKINKAWYYDLQGEKQSVEADMFVVACQAVESVRLLQMSATDEHPGGLGNHSNQLGKNLLFSGGGIGSGSLNFSDFNEDDLLSLRNQGLFINRALYDWYEIDDSEFGGKVKGGMADFVWEHSNPVTKAVKLKKEGGELVWGNELKQKVKHHFTQQKTLKYEVFTDWTPHENCRVELSAKHKDKWGDPIAKVHLGEHPYDRKIAKFIAEKAADILREVGAKDVSYSLGGASANLQAGGCRFGDDPNSSVLDKNCKVHSLDNLYVTDASFMPTGGSVTYTWTIYANSYRVADHLLSRLSNNS